MKNLLLIATVVFSLSAQADTLEIVTGSITEHFIAPNGTEWFTKKLGSGGKLIYNPLYALKYTFESETSYKSITAFSGDNSVGYPMIGGTFAYGWRAFSNHLYYDGVIGAYHQEATFGNPTAFLDKLINTGMVPIIGVEINGKINLGTRPYLKLNNLITPILSSTSVSFGINL